MPKQESTFFLKQIGLPSKGTGSVLVLCTARLRNSSSASHYTRHELYARIGRLHRDAEAGSYRMVRSEVMRCVARPEVEADPQLKIRAFALLGNHRAPSTSILRPRKTTGKQVLAIAKATGDAKWENRANGELGILAGVNGNVGAAGAALFKAISKADELGDTPGHIHFVTWLANGMSVHGMADKALPMIVRASELAKSNGYAEIPLSLSIAKIRAMTLLPEPQRSRAREEVKTLLSETLAQAERNHVLGAQTELLNMAGQLALEERDFVGAEKSLTRAIEVARAASLPRIEADALLHLSEFYLATKRAGKAAPVIDRAIEVQKQVEEGYDLPLFIAEKAEVQAALGSLQQADALYERATSLVEGLLVNAPSSRVKSSMIGAMSEIYLGHFRLAWNQLHNGPEAFRIIEGARGRALLDSIRYARQSSPTDKAVAAETEIAHLQATLLHAELSLAQTRRVLTQLDDAYDRLSPVEYTRNRKEMMMLRRPPVSVAVLQKQLRPDENFVEYVVDAKESYAIQVTPSSLAIHTLPGRSELNKMARSFLATVKSKSDSTSVARDLYQGLISPIAPQHLSRLILVPDGPLNLIPFGALVSDDKEYLDKQLTLSTVPSATVYVTLKTATSRSAASRPFLGVAYSPVSGTPLQTVSSSRGLADLRGGSPAPLQFAREEVAEAAQSFGSNSVVLDGGNASEAALKAEPLGDFRIIHIAAHGIGDETEPDRAALVLLPGSNEEDGLWQAREIRQSRLNADLVVLSACETGTGRLQGEEGVMNLARAFLIAGARSVVASLWSVEDSSTATLMGFFYEHFAAGLSVSESLRQAQIDFIREYKGKAQPYYWAGFEVIGDGTRRITLETSKLNPQAARTDLR